MRSKSFGNRHSVGHANVEIELKGMSYNKHFLDESVLCISLEIALSIVCDEDCDVDAHCDGTQGLVW